MPTTKLLLASLFAAGAVAAQPPNPVDTLPRKDSLIEEVRESVAENIPTLSLDDNDLGDVGSQNVSSVLTAGRDPFFTAASFNFSPVRFRIRGYDADLFSTYMNGVPMENLDNGFTPFGLWGGLNDVMRNREVSLGLRYNTFAFGDIGSSTHIDSRASKQRVQTNLSYAYSNRTYHHRVMATHSTGLNRQGWAFTLSGSRRYAGEGYVPGTHYDGWSYFAAADKRVGQKHLLSLVAFGAPTENGRQAASVKEIQNLAGTHYYNPSWGFQNGKVRNASVARSHQPYLIATHDFRINEKHSWVTAAGYSFGKRSTTALDWYNSADPRPDYYRYLPSYYRATDPGQAAQLEQAMRADIHLRQINWAALYNANRSNPETVTNANGIQGNNVTGLRSHYVLEERVVDTRRLNFNSTLHSRVSDDLDLSFGLTYQRQKNNYYKELEDLLGGEFYVDLNQFAERDYPNDPNANQNDLNRPNRILSAGDRFGYDYDINIHRAAAWAQAILRLNKVDLFLASELSGTRFWRVGNVRNGLFPNNSFGKSSVNSFTNYAFKGGATYKIDGRNYLYLHGAYLTRAPFFENAYVSPRTRDFVQSHLTSSKIRSAEGGYIMNAPRMKIRLTGFYTGFQDELNVLSFYHDEFRNFVNYGLSNIDKLHFGGEFGFEVSVFPGFSVNGAASVGRYYYDSRQNAVITLDNSAAILGEQTVFNLNYRVPSTPQEAYSFGFNYRSPKFWYVSLTGNYFDQMWLDFNPIRRTPGAVDGIEYKSELWNTILRQTRWDAQYTLDFFGGYSWKLPSKMEVGGKSTFLVFNLGINNILDNRDIVTGGYEQLRFDFENRDVNKFPPKIYYGFGANFFASVNLRF
ncbi:MAG TPA: TonB-dependent receptor [Chitinophagaceae bacterium]|nr:TonB-dependent receptor [Chitinophagaceae bacterium]